jgi:hypothetical protein
MRQLGWICYSDVVDANAEMRRARWWMLRFGRLYVAFRVLMGKGVIYRAHFAGGITLPPQNVCVIENTFTGVEP